MCCSEQFQKHSITLARKLWESQKLLEDFICSSIKEFDASKVYQVITDNASAVSKARDKVSETYPHIVTGGCTSHSLDLHLEDIGSLSFFKDLLAEGKEVVKFVRNHGTVLACYRKCPNFTELEMYNETRFTTEVTIIRSMIKNCNHLEGAIVAPAVKEWISKSPKKTKDLYQQVKNTIMRESFWKKAKAFDELVTPAVKLLRIADDNQTWSLC